MYKNVVKCKGILKRKLIKPKKILVQLNLSPQMTYENCVEIPTSLRFPAEKYFITLSTAGIYMNFY